MRKRRDVEIEARSTAIIRRAIELDRIEPSEDGGGLSQLQLAQIAGDLDISPAALNSALVEAKAGVDGRQGLVDRLVGPRHISAKRSASVDEEAITVRVLEWLEVTHGLRPRVTSDGVVVATKRRDLAGVVGTGIRRAQGFGGLSTADEIKAAVVTTGTDAQHESAVCLVADVGHSRSGAIVAGSAVAAGGSLVIGMVTLLVGPAAWVGVPLAAGAGALGARLVHRTTVRRVGESIDQTIDGVALGNEPPRPVGAFKRRRSGSNPASS